MLNCLSGTQYIISFLYLHLIYHVFLNNINYDVIELFSTEMKKYRGEESAYLSIYNLFIILVALLIY